MEKNSIQVFNNEMFGSLRTIVLPNGQIGFVGKDVAEMLGYQNGSRDINRHVDSEDRMVLKIYDGCQNRDTIIISESGLYALILSSKLPSARKFKHWVTSDVLPAIRKTGGYIPTTPEDDEKTILCKALLIMQRTAEMQKELIADQSAQIAAQEDIIEAQVAEIADRELEIEQHHVIIDDLRQQTQYLRTIEGCKGDVNINQIALDYGWSAIHMNQKLHQLGVQYNQGGQWILYQKYKGKGYTNSYTAKHIDGIVRMHTKWTQKGRRFIYDLLREENILPCCER